MALRRSLTSRLARHLLRPCPRPCLGSVVAAVSVTLPSDRGTALASREATLERRMRAWHSLALP